MSMYDPTQDPRWLPGEDVESSERRLDIEEEIERIGEGIRQYDLMLAMCSTPGWVVFTDGLKAQKEQLETLLIKERDQSAWKFYRGQLTQVEWCLQVHSEALRRQKVLRSKRADLLQRIEEGAS